MSDNISADEVKRRLVIFLQIPNEVWTDVLKLLPRHILVQNIAPVCYRFKEISDKNVKNIHVIENAGQFHNKLEEDDPEANQQLEHLAGNNCQLAGQFRLTHLWIRNEKSQVILRHCLDLFNGCKIEFYFTEKTKDSTLFLECLGQLEEAKPVQINVIQRVDQVIDFWPHPTFQHCTRLDLHYRSSLSPATLTTAFENIVDWLHLQPTDGMDCDGNAAAVDQQVRGMIVQLHDSYREHVDLLLRRCSQSLQQSQKPTDRRPFVCSFSFDLDADWPGFGQFRRVANKSTGEVLLLDRVLNASGHPFYRLRRSLAEEEANGAEFYAGMFKQLWGYEQFNIDIDNKKTPEVII